LSDLTPLPPAVEPDKDAVVEPEPRHQKSQSEAQAG
jgi:hypothetical protein